MCSPSDSFWELDHRKNILEVHLAKSQATEWQFASAPPLEEDIKENDKDVMKFLVGDDAHVAKNKKDEDVKEKDVMKVLFWDDVHVAKNKTTISFVIDKYRVLSDLFWSNTYNKSPLLQENWFSYMVYVVFSAAAYAFFNQVFSDKKWSVALFVFQRAFGLIWISVWISTWWQVYGLIGNKGVIPIKQSLNESSLRATLFGNVFTADNEGITMHCILGMMSSVCFFLNLFPGPLMIVNCVLYLSIKSVGGL